MILFIFNMDHFSSTKPIVIVSIGCFFLYITIYYSLFFSIQDVFFGFGTRPLEKRKIFMVFPYYQESALLLLKILYLGSIIDKFVLLISNMTFVGYPQNPPLFAPYEKDLKPYFETEKIFIFHTNLNDFSLCNESFYFDGSRTMWKRECVMRNSAKPALIKAGIRINDCFFVGDADEFPSYSSADYLLSNPPKSFVNILHETTFCYTFYFTESYKACKFAFVRYTNHMPSMNFIRFANKPIESKKVFCFHLHNAFPNIQLYIHKYYRSHPHRNLQNQVMNSMPFCDLFFLVFKGKKIMQSLPQFPTHLVRDSRLHFLFQPIPFPESWPNFTKCLNFPAFQQFFNFSYNNDPRY